MSNPFATRYTRPGAIDYLFDRGQSLEALVGRLRDHGWWGAILGPHGSGKSTLLAALTPALEAAGRRVVRLMISPVSVMPASVGNALRSVPEGSGFGVQGSDCIAATSGCAENTAATSGRAENTAATSGRAEDTAATSGREKSVAWIQPSEAYQAAADQAPDAALQLVVDGYEQLSWWTRRRIESLCRNREAGLLVTAHQPVGLPVLLTTEPSLALAQQIVERLLPDGETCIKPDDVAAAFAKTGGNLRETLFALFDVYQARRKAQ